MQKALMSPKIFKEIFQPLVLQGILVDLVYWSEEKSETEKKSDC